MRTDKQLEVLKQPSVERANVPLDRPLDQGSKWKFEKFGDGYPQGEGNELFFHPTYSLPYLFLQSRFGRR
jgi:hypothetical protein